MYGRAVYETPLAMGHVEMSDISTFRFDLRPIMRWIQCHEVLYHGA